MKLHPEEIFSNRKSSRHRQKLGKITLEKFIVFTVTLTAQLLLQGFILQTTEGPHFFNFLEFKQIVGEKEEKFQHGGRESRILPLDA